MTARLQNALNNFVNNESDLLIQDSHEASITGLLVEYLAESFDDFDYDIDTQYNKRILENEIVNKQMEFLITNLPLHKWPKTWDNNQEYTKKELLPDIIFHDRGSGNHNYLVIEVKKSTNKSISDREWDLIKLSEMTSRDLNYEYGAFIEFTTGSEFNNEKPYSLTLFSKGEIIHAE